MLPLFSLSSCMLVEQFSVLQKTDDYQPFSGFITMPEKKNKTSETSVLTDITKEVQETELVKQPKIYPSRTSPRTSATPENDLKFARKLTYKVNKKKTAVSWLIFKDTYYNDMCAIPLRYEFECLQDRLYCIPYSGDDTELEELHIPEIKALKITEHYPLCRRRVGITKGKRLPNIEEFIRIFHPEFYNQLKPMLEDPPQVSNTRYLFSNLNCQEPFQKPYIPVSTAQAFDLKKGDTFPANPFTTDEGELKYTYWKILSNTPEPVHYLDSQGTCSFIENGFYVTQLSNKDTYAQLKKPIRKAMKAHDAYCQNFCDAIHEEAKTYHWLEIPEDSTLITDNENL